MKLKPDTSVCLYKRLGLRLAHIGVLYYMLLGYQNADGYSEAKTKGKLE